MSHCHHIQDDLLSTQPLSSYCFENNLPDQMNDVQYRLDLVGIQMLEKVTYPSRASIDLYPFIDFCHLIGINNRPNNPLKTPTFLKAPR